MGLQHPVLCQRTVEVEHATIPEPRGKGVFRLAYASRATSNIERNAVVYLAANAAECNRRNDVSGVLFSGNGIFLQWLEGSKADVCSLMDRISADPRHDDVTVLNAGWIPARRYANWPMQLSNQLLKPRTNGYRKSAPPYDPDHALRAFDEAAESYQRDTQLADRRSVELLQFAKSLVTCSTERLPNLPYPDVTDLAARAQLVDDVCAVFASGWKNDEWSSAEVTVGLANLNLLWHRAGRVNDPLRPHSCVAIVVPPGNREILGAIVTADLLRANGMTVQMVLGQTVEEVAKSVSRSGAQAISVAGTHVLQASSAAQAEPFVQALRERLPHLPVHVGGRSAGRLCEWPDRLRSRLDDADLHESTRVNRLAMAALSIVARQQVH